MASPLPLQHANTVTLVYLNFTGEDERIFRVYKLNTLFFTLINSIKSQENEGFPKESLALTQLKKDLFEYTPGISCQVSHNTIHHDFVNT
jgi:hypothetical protein